MTAVPCALAFPIVFSAVVPGEDAVAGEGRLVAQAVALRAVDGDDAETPGAIRAVLRPPERDNHPVAPVPGFLLVREEPEDFGFASAGDFDGEVHAPSLPEQQRLASSPGQRFAGAGLRRGGLREALSGFLRPGTGRPRDSSQSDGAGSFSGLCHTAGQALA
jgi:hypothetical protein